MAELTPLLSDPNQEVRQIALDGIRLVINKIFNDPLPADETKASVTVLHAYGQGEHPENMKKQANKLANKLTVLLVINGNSTQVSQPGSLPFNRFDYPADERGRRGYFQKQDSHWREFKGNRRWGQLRETMRTPEYIELFSFRRAIWVRIDRNRATWSNDQQNWKLIGKGKAITE